MAGVYATKQDVQLSTMKLLALITAGGASGAGVMKIALKMFQ